MASFKKKTKVAILGGGLSGLTVAARLEKAGIDYLLLEAQDLGGSLKGQTVNGAALDYGLKSIPVQGAIGENPLVQLKDDLELDFQIESYTESAKIFDNKSFGEFVGFGETKNRKLIEELSYYTSAPRLLVSGGWGNLTEGLLRRIPQEKILTSAHITKMNVQEERVTSVVVNGESSVEAEQFVFTLSPAILKDFLPSGVVSGKLLQRIARTQPFAAISLDLASEVPPTQDKNIFVLRDSTKSSDDELLVVGQFVSQLDPVRPSGNFHISTWMTLTDSETLNNDEEVSKMIKTMKKLVSKAFPGLIENAKWERLLVVPGALGNFTQLTLEKNSTLPGLSNLWVCGGKVQSATQRNLGLALDSARTISLELSH